MSDEFLLNRIEALKNENNMLWLTVNRLEQFAIQQMDSPIPQFQCVFCGAALLEKDFKSLGGVSGFPHMDTCHLRGLEILRKLKGGKI